MSYHLVSQRASAEIAVLQLQEFGSNSLAGSLGGQFSWWPVLLVADTELKAHLLTPET